MFIELTSFDNRRFFVNIEDIVMFETYSTDVAIEKLLEQGTQEAHLTASLLEQRRQIMKKCRCLLTIRNISAEHGLQDTIDEVMEKIRKARDS